MFPDLHHMNYHNHHPSLLLHSMNHNIFHCVQACHHVLVIASQSGATNSILPNCYHITMGVNGERVLTSMGARTIGDAALKIPPRVTCCWCVSSMESVLRAGPLDGEEYGCVLVVSLLVAAPHFERICGRSFLENPLDVSFHHFSRIHCKQGNSLMICSPF